MSTLPASKDHSKKKGRSKSVIIKDGTPSLRFDLTERLKKYFFFVENVSITDQPMSPERMIKNQIFFYERAIDEILEEFSI
mmetsp:Transcript_23648/g.36342  ORF Transcript_23648/g.36342 Transcript_23648/m.36342 type:complete len:81 (+) Transcript_23648:930-1172(+)